MIWCTCRSSRSLSYWFLWINLWCDWALTSDASMRSVSSTTTTHSVPPWIYSESNPCCVTNPRTLYLPSGLACGTQFLSITNAMVTQKAFVLSPSSPHMGFAMGSVHFSSSPRMGIDARFAKYVNAFKHTLKKEFERLTLVRTPPIVVMDDESGLQPFKFKFTLA